MSMFDHLKVGDEIGVSFYGNPHVCVVTAETKTTVTARDEVFMRSTGNRRGDAGLRKAFCYLMTADAARNAKTKVNADLEFAAAKNDLKTAVGSIRTGDIKDIKSIRKMVNRLENSMKTIAELNK